MGFPTREQVEETRKNFPIGSIVVLDRMDDPQAKPPGTFGVVRWVDDTASVGVSWHGGGSLYVIYGVDKCHVANEEEMAKYKLLLLSEHQPQNRCPRCGAVITQENRLLALSRRQDILICEHCGTFESLEDAGMTDKIPVTEWIAVKEDWKPGNSATNGGPK